MFSNKMFFNYILSTFRAIKDLLRFESYERVENVKKLLVTRTIKNLQYSKTTGDCDITPIIV